MRRFLLVAITTAGVALPLAAGTALALAEDAPERSRASAGLATPPARTVPRFEIEIDPELDARFGPRPVDAVEAAAIVTGRFAGARVLEAELDERGGGPIWEMEFRFGGDEREVEVDAVTGALLAGGPDDD